MTVDIELSALADNIAALATSRRIIVAMAGAPGAGKSMIAEQLVTLLDNKARGMTAVLPMDGYHYDDRLLDELGRRRRKGALDTFDVGGFKAMLLRLRANSEDAVAVPVFDRDIEIARAGARLVPRNVRVIVTEGNYLLLRDGAWAELKPLFDVTVFIDSDEETLRSRLEERWRGYGLPPDVIGAKVEENDLPNGRFVKAESTAADYRIRN